MEPTQAPPVSDAPEATTEPPVATAEPSPEAQPGAKPRARAAAMTLAENGYIYDSATKTLTVSTNEGTTAWRDDPNLALTDIEAVVIESGVTEIGEEAFFKCSNLSSAIIPEGVTSIEYACFSKTDLVEVKIPASVTSVGDESFSRCNSLMAVYFISETPAYMGSFVFVEVDDVKIFVPKANVQEYKRTWLEFKNFIYPAKEYSYDTATKTLTLSTNESTAQWRDDSNIARNDVESVVLGQGVTEIEQDAFKDCGALTSVTIPDGVTSIGEAAFAGTALTKLTIPSSVTAIGNQAFNGCTALVSINMESETPVGQMGTAVFDNIGANFMIFVPNNTALAAYKAAWAEYEENIFAAPDYSYNAETKTLTVRNNSAIKAWRDAPNLAPAHIEAVVFEAGVTEIGAEAFMDCSNLSSATISQNVTSIGAAAFAGTKLTAITIPASVTQIGANAFNGTVSLSSVTMEGETPALLGANAFGTLAADAVIHVPSPAAVSVYKAKADWAAYKDRVSFAAAFSSLTANGDASTSTTKLTLTFDKNMNGLAAEDIVLTGATKGSLTANESKTVYTLEISDITVADEAKATVTIERDSCTFTPASREVSLRKITTEPTTSPSTAPTTQPSTAPTTEPSTAPTTEPSTAPTTEPSTAPTTEPSTNPTAAPTTNPTIAPTNSPATANPTATPIPAPTTGDSNSNLIPWVVLMAAAVIALAILCFWIIKKRGGEHGA